MSGVKHRTKNDKKLKLAVCTVAGNEQKKCSSSLDQLFPRSINIESKTKSKKKPAYTALRRKNRKTLNTRKRQRRRQKDTGMKGGSSKGKGKPGMPHGTGPPASSIRPRMQACRSQKTGCLCVCVVVLSYKEKSFSGLSTKYCTSINYVRVAPTDMADSRAYTRGKEETTRTRYTISLWTERRRARKRSGPTARPRYEGGAPSLASFPPQACGEALLSCRGNKPSSTHAFIPSCGPSFSSLPRLVGE